MSLIESLLNTDASKFKRDTREIEIKRLSKNTGSPFILKIQNITAQEQKEIEDETFKIGKRNKIDYNPDLNKKLTIIKAVTNFDFKDKALLEHIGAYNSHDAIDKLFKPGEIEEITEQIKEISGYDDGVVEEVKN